MHIQFPKIFDIWFNFTIRDNTALHHGGPGGHPPDLPVAGAEHPELTRSLAVLNHLAIFLVKRGVGKHLAKLPDFLPNLQPKGGDTVGSVSTVVLSHREVASSFSGEKSSVRVDRIFGLFHVKSSFAHGPEILEKICFKPTHFGYLWLISEPNIYLTKPNAMQTKQKHKEQTETKIQC